MHTLVVRPMKEVEYGWAYPYQVLAVPGILIRPQPWLTDAKRVFLGSQTKDEMQMR
jgi:hypothetical protein